jgi:hypothetical protein
MVHIDIGISDNFAHVVAKKILVLGTCSTHRKFNLNSEAHRDILYPRTMVPMLTLETTNHFPEP